MDYDLEYTDSSGTTKLLPRTGLPTRELIVRFSAIRASDHAHVSDISPIQLETLEIVTMGGSSGLIHSDIVTSKPREHQ
ncbi:hypothetical protein FRC00_011520 [Tulasnella sp. 408]|nr:hypothetical protein FRC00_011520 [Tulasnella sp. 408]